MNGLGDGFPGTVRTSYPHMLAEDRVIWTRFLERYGGEVTRCWYDVHVGRAVPLPPEVGPEYLAVVEGVTKKRIDAVVLWRGRYCVVEVKPYAGFTALGQALAYTRLFRVEFATVREVVAMVVCGKVDVDLVDDFALHNVEVVQVGLGGGVV